jgi:hypothetical protein
VTVRVPPVGGPGPANGPPTLAEGRGRAVHVRQWLLRVSRPSPWALSELTPGSVLSLLIRVPVCVTWIQKDNVLSVGPFLLFLL